MNAPNATSDPIQEISNLFATRFKGVSAKVSSLNFVLMGELQPIAVPAAILAMLTIAPVKISLNLEPFSDITRPKIDTVRSSHEPKLH